MLIDPAHIFSKFKPVCPRHHDVGNNQLIKIVIHFIICCIGIQAALCMKPAVIEVSTYYLI